MNLEFLIKRIFAKERQSNNENPDKKRNLKEQSVQNHYNKSHTKEFILAITITATTNAFGMKRFLFSKRYHHTIFIKKDLLCAIKIRLIHSTLFIL